MKITARTHEERFKIYKKTMIQPRTALYFSILKYETVRTLAYDLIRLCWTIYCNNTVEGCQVVREQTIGRFR